MSAVTLSNVIKRYGALQVVHGIDLEIRAGECIALTGPEGSGKLMILRMVAGIQPVTSGRIVIGGRDVTRAPADARGVAVAAPAAALPPRRSVAATLERDLKQAGHPAAEIERLLARAVRDWVLDGLLDRRPAALSAAERARVVLARALARDPGLLLLDDPLAGLAAEARDALRIELARLLAKRGITTIHATEDRSEAMALADRIVVLRDGRIAQMGAPLDLYRDPDTRFVAGFIGRPAMNFLAAVAVEDGLDVPALGRRIEVRQRLREAEVTLGFRPEHARLAAGDAFEVELAEPLGSVTHAHLRAATGERLVVEERGEARARRGDRVTLDVDPDRLLLFDAGTGLRIR